MPRATRAGIRGDITLVRRWMTNTGRLASATPRAVRDRGAAALRGFFEVSTHPASLPFGTGAFPTLVFLAGRRGVIKRAEFTDRTSALGRCRPPAIGRVVATKLVVAHHVALWQAFAIHDGHFLVRHALKASRIRSRWSDLLPMLRVISYPGCARLRYKQSSSLLAP